MIFHLFSFANISNFQILLYMSPVHIIKVCVVCGICANASYKLKKDLNYF